MHVPEGRKVLTHDCYLVLKIQCILEKAWVASSTDQMQLHCVAVQDGPRMPGDWTALSAGVWMSCSLPSAYRSPACSDHARASGVN